MPEERRVRLTVNFPHENLLRRGEGFSRRRWGGHAHLTQRLRGTGISSCAPHSIASRPLSSPWSEERAGE